MRVFADTSGLYALLDRADRHHEVAHERFVELAAAGASVLTSQLVVAETTALVQRRLGLAAAHDLHATVLRYVDVVGLSTTQFARAVDRWHRAAARRLSLVDVTSFVAMEALGIERAFAVDRDFDDAGFATLLP